MICSKGHPARPFGNFAICDTCGGAFDPSDVKDETPKALPSTKARSLAATNLSASNAKVLAFIKSNPNLSRSEIARQSNTRLQTVCGAVRRLLDIESIEVSGEKFDIETQRSVETLKAKELNK